MSLDSQISSRKSNPVTRKTLFYIALIMRASPLYDYILLTHHPSSDQGSPACSTPFCFCIKGYVRVMNELED